MDLVIMCGLPASGKSTFAQESYEVVICPDEIRKELGVVFDASLEPKVWDIAYNRTKEQLQKHNKVCFDATNTTQKRRKALIDIAISTGANCHCIYVPTPIDICIARDNSRKVQLPAEVFDRMNKQFEAPIIEEGFDTILTIRNY